MSVYHTLLEAYNVMRHLSSKQINMKWKLIERKYALRSITKKKLNVPEKPKLKCLGFTYNAHSKVLLLRAYLKVIFLENIVFHSFWVATDLIRCPGVLGKIFVPPRLSRGCTGRGGWIGR